MWQVQPKGITIINIIVNQNLVQQNNYINENVNNYYKKKKKKLINYKK